VNTRRLILFLIVLLVLLGLGNFVFNSIQTRAQLSQVAAKDTSAQEQGIQRLMARGVLFDALQGGAPPETRLNAIGALQRLADGGKNPAAFKELLQMLKDPDTESAEKKTHPVRDAAKDAVAAVGVGYPDLLIAAAKDPDGNIKDQSRNALKKIGAPLKEEMAAKLDDSALRAPLGDILSSIGPETVPLIAPYLAPEKLQPPGKEVKPEDVVKAKVELIETLGKFKVPEAATPIIPFRNDEDPNVRRSVVTSLSNIGDPVGAPVLIAALNDPATDASARAAAAGALGAIATPEANAAMVKALSDYDLSVANAAAAGLKRAGEQAAGAIAQALANPDPAVRARAASAAGGLRTTAVAARALKDPDTGVRSAAAAAIGDVLFRAYTVRTDLANLASAADDKARDTAYAELVKDGAVGELSGAGAPPAARANAVAALTAQAAAKEKEEDRKKVEEQIAKVNAGEGAPTVPLATVDAATLAPLIATLGDPEGVVAQGAVRSLARVGEPAIGPLVAALSGANDTVAYNASQALVSIGGPAVDALLGVAQADKPGARWAAVTLGQIGDPRAMPALEGLARSPDPDTANAATAALAKVRPS
jgi:HEAT repeat protein